jgi:membrane-bound ClpP family serine protease
MTIEGGAQMDRSGASGMALIVFGVVFIAIGSSGQRTTFIVVGAAFAVIGVVLLIRRRTAGLK